MQIKIIIRYNSFYEIDQKITGLKENTDPKVSKLQWKKSTLVYYLRCINCYDLSGKQFASTTCKKYF